MVEFRVEKLTLFDLCGRSGVLFFKRVYFSDQENDQGDDLMAKLLSCPSCGAHDSQEEVAVNEFKCGYCNATYVKNFRNSVAAQVVSVRRAVSRKEADKNFGIWDLLKALVIILFFWGFFTIWSGTFIMVIGSFCLASVTGQFMSPLVAYGLGAVGTFIVGVIFLNAKK